MNRPTVDEKLREAAEDVERASLRRSVPLSPVRRARVPALVAAAVMTAAAAVWVSAAVVERPAVVDFADAKRQDPGWARIEAAPIRPRTDHTMVWSGREAIVWGGVSRGGGELLNDGAAYDPATDRWRVLPEAPIQARYAHVAAWTGQEMIVWGGLTSTSEGGAEGAAYDPVRDAWRVIAPRAPLADPVYAWTGDRLVVWGHEVGADELAPPVLAIYDPAEDTWHDGPAGPLNSRLGASGVWTGSRLVVWGGQEWDSERARLTSTASGAAFSPATEKWEPLPKAPLSPRFGHSAVWTGAAMVVWGGAKDDAASPVFDDGAAFDPRGNTWKPLAPSPLGGRSEHAAHWLDGSILVWGGQTRAAENEWTAHADGALYDVARDQWRVIEGAPDAGSVTSAPSVAADGRLLVWGVAVSDDGVVALRFRVPPD